MKTVAVLYFKGILISILIVFHYYPVQGRQQQLSYHRDTTITSPFTPTPNRSNIWLMAGITTGLYGGALSILNNTWYNHYPKTRFHAFDDRHEWLQMDKAGHVYSAYMEGKISREMWRCTGLPEKQQIWIGGLSGFVYQSVIEILDAYSAEWGFSWTDMAANAGGSTLMIGQELLWHEQRIQLKFSAYPKRYADPGLKTRTDQLFGDNLAERTLKDYNAQTYWLSVNVHAFMRSSRVPSWLNIALGYGANGMFKGDNNIWKDGDGIEHNYSAIPRYRQFYLSPDIDFTRIPTRRKSMKVLFQVLNMVKFPAPTLELTSRGSFRAHMLHF
jgi:hypothetical protein